MLTDKPGAAPTVRALARLCEEIVEGEAAADCNVIIESLQRNELGEWWLQVIAVKEGE